MTEQRWIIAARPRFLQWLEEQDTGTQKRILANPEMLGIQGPALGRPFADTVQGSAFSNMKELRVQCKGKPIRAFFAFDPLRKAIILCAGDKTGDKRFHERMIPVADQEYKDYLDEEYDEL